MIKYSESYWEEVRKVVSGIPDIANLFGISKQRVNYWIHRSIKTRKRRTKLIRREINMIVKWAKDKPIM